MPSYTVINPATEAAVPRGHIGDLPYALLRRIVLQELECAEARANFTLACPYLVEMMLHRCIFVRCDLEDALLWGPEAESQEQILRTISDWERLLDAVWWTKWAVLNCVHDNTRDSMESA